MLQELRCVPAVFAAENLNTIVKAAGVSVDAYWPSLFAKLFAKKSVEDLIANVGARKFSVCVWAWPTFTALRPPRLLGRFIHAV